MVRRIYGCALALALLPALLSAQQGTESKDSKAEMFMVNDIKVILSPAQNELVSVIVGLEGGIGDGETKNPALSGFAADLIAASGSKSYTKDQLRRFLSKTSTRLSGESDNLGLSFSMTSTRARFDEAWNVLSSLIREPLYDEVEFRNIMQRRVARAQSAFSNPERYAFRMVDSLVKINHPHLARYTYESDLEEITIPKIKSFMEDVSTRSNMVVVIVGKVTKKEITEKLAAFSDWSKGDYRPPVISRLRSAPEPTVEIVDMPDKPTTYIFAGFAGPPLSEPEEAWALAVGMKYLRDVLFREIRTKRNLSYAPFAFVGNSHGQGVGVLGVSTVWPDSSMKIMLDEMQKMRDGDFEEEAIENAVQGYITNYYFREMTNARKAVSLYENERYTGDWRNAFSYDEINEVDKGSVQRVFRKYARTLQVGIVGKQDAVTVAEFEYVNGPVPEWHDDDDEGEDG